MAKLVVLYFFILSFTFGFSTGFSQKAVTDSTQPQKQRIKVSDNKHGFYFSTGLIYQNILMAEIGVLYGKRGDNQVGIHGASGYPIQSGIKLSTEFYFGSNSTIFGPKLSYESEIFSLIGGRMNVINYTDFTVNDICITPEAGLSIAGYFTIFYGYNIHLSNTRIKGISNHRLSVTLNL